ncbi:hypothetical protein D3C80_1134040 [compost metagenome]
MIVEPVAFSKSNAPNTTKGTVVNTTKDTLKDWKLAVSIRKITMMAINKPFARLSIVSSNTGIIPATFTFTPFGNSPKEAMAASTSFCALAKSVL